MSKKKVRAGHRGFLTKVIEEVGPFFEVEYATASKIQLLKWKASLMGQIEKISPLDEQILEELAADEKATEEDIADEIERSGRLRVDATQILAAIEEQLAEHAAEFSTALRKIPAFRWYSNQ